MIKEVEVLKQNSYKVVFRLVWQKGAFSYDFTCSASLLKYVGTLFKVMFHL